MLVNTVSLYNFCHSSGAILASITATDSK